MPTSTARTADDIAESIRTLVDRLADAKLTHELAKRGHDVAEEVGSFAEEVGSVKLTPDATGGVFDVRINDELIWSRKERGRFPESKELKQLVRDRIAPGRSLGHSDSA